MANYTITKENNITTIKNEMKEKISNTIKNALRNEGIGEVKDVRIISGSSVGKNTLAVNVGTILEDGFEFDFNYQIDIIFKSYKDKIVKNKTYAAFDIEESVNNYREWEEKEKEKKRIKEEKETKRKETAEKTKTTNRIEE